MSVISLKTKQKYGTLLAGNEFFMPNSFESIATISSTSTLFNFTSIPQTYQHLQIRGIVTPSTGGYTPYVRYNTSNGTYAHQLIGNGSAVSATSTATFMNIASSGGIDSVQPFVFIIDVHDYANTTKNKTFRAFTGQDINGSGGQIVLASGFRNDTTAITELGMTIGISSTISAALYGIKGA